MGQEGLCFIDFVTLSISVKKALSQYHNGTQSQTLSSKLFFFVLMEIWPICDFIGSNLDLETVT